MTNIVTTIAGTLIVLSMQLEPFPQTTSSWVAQLPGSSGFSIYCTSNLDSTGACNRVDNNQPVACLIVPGDVINCKQKNEPLIECVIYSGIINTQAYFYCTHSTDPGIRPNRINTQRFTPASQKEKLRDETPNNTQSQLQNDFNQNAKTPEEAGVLNADIFN